MMYSAKVQAKRHTRIGRRDRPQRLEYDSIRQERQRRMPCIVFDLPSGGASMYVREFMSSDPVCCGQTSSLAEVARLMVDRNCGEIPIVASGDSGKLIGVITDRDITCRTVAQGLNPLELTAADCMSSPVVTVTPDTVL